MKTFDFKKFICHCPILTRIEMNSAGKSVVCERSNVRIRRKSIPIGFPSTVRFFDSVSRREVRNSLATRSRFLTIDFVIVSF